MYNRIKIFLLFAGAGLLMATEGCKKGSFDINSPNPNVPSAVSPKYSLSAALNSTAFLATNGSQDFMNYWMGYWAVSGDYIPSNSVVLYQLTTDYFSNNWDGAYLNLQNYKLVEDEGAADPLLAKYQAIAKIMKSYVYQRVVDLYNNAPYTEALGGTNYSPVYDNGADIYSACITQLDSAVTIINNASVDAENPSDYDIMFHGDMSMWIKFANTLKLKMLMRETEVNGSSIAGQLSGLTADDFLGAGENAAVNPGYSNASNSQQNPMWQDIGYNTSGTAYTDNSYYRACSYAVNFYINNNDPRAYYFYETKSDGQVHGRAFGSTNLEHNSEISGMGPGILVDPGMDAILLPGFESLFLQAEAIQRGYMSGDAGSMYNDAVTESFRLLGVEDYASAASDYTSQSNNANTNYTYSSNKLKTIITQKWAACNMYDPLESYSDWRRLNIPSDLPVSIYPGSTATHIPYRLLYPSSEYNYNAANVSAEGTIDFLTSKIFWMP